tara:strand:- start:5 stop:169 length:165 start_codon:yes stop_codon:yes gene_type:complete
MNVKKYNKAIAYRKLPKAVKRQKIVNNKSSLSISELDMLNHMKERLSDQAKELD